MAEEALLKEVEYKSRFSAFLVFAVKIMQSNLKFHQEEANKKCDKFKGCDKSQKIKWDTRRKKRISIILFTNKRNVRDK